jgi:thymidylate synthase
VDEEFERRNSFESGVFGPVYGFQLRHFGGNYNKGIHQPPGYGAGGFDQLAWVVNRIKQDTSCRRILWSLWNPKDVDQMRLPPCHLLYQILIDDQRRMTGIMYQRSCDFPIGVPANIQFYSAITVMLAQQTDCTPYEFVHMTADSHIYWDQIEAVKEYLALPVIESPKLEIRKAKDIFSYTLDDFILRDFTPGPKLEIPVAV